jgi:GldM C-terminal domain
MKILFASISVFIGYAIYSQTSIELPEYNILYMSYSNKLIINGGCWDSIVVKNNGVPLEKSQYEGNQVYLIRPQKSGLEQIIVQGYKNGNIVESDTNNYKVKPFPAPVLYTNIISKSAGALVNAGLDPSCPLAISYSVQGGEILVGEEIPFSGNRIPGNLVSKIKVGQNVGIICRITNNETGITEMIRGVLTVNP